MAGPRQGSRLQNMSFCILPQACCGPDEEGPDEEDPYDDPDDEDELTDASVRHASILYNTTWYTGPRKFLQVML